MQITSYNFHLGLLRSELCRVNTEQSTRAVARPASLRHQPGDTENILGSPCRFCTFSFDVWVEQQLSYELERQPNSTRKDKQNAIHGHRQNHLRKRRRNA